MDVNTAAREKQLAQLEQEFDGQSRLEILESLADAKGMVDELHKSLNQQIEIAHDACYREEIALQHLNMAPAKALIHDINKARSPMEAQTIMMAHMIDAVRSLKEEPLIPATDFFAMVSEFQKKFGHEKPVHPIALSDEMDKLKRIHLAEELEEYADAVCLEDCLDALVDLVYVALGTAYSHGFDFNEAFRRVHEANMRKERATDSKQSKRGTSLDIIKPVGWKPAYLGDLVK
jgi:hypothetical protein